MRPGQRLQAVLDGREGVGGDEFLVRQHAGMCNGGPHVVGHQPVVECVILPGGLAEDFLVEGFALVPKPGHDPPSERLPCCSAGDRLSMLSTTSVPVPSFVKTSSRMLSGNL